MYEPTSVASSFLYPQQKIDGTYHHHPPEKKHPKTMTPET